MKLLILIAILGLFKQIDCMGAGQEYVVSNDQLLTMEAEGDLLLNFDNIGTIGRERLLNGSVVFVEDMDDDHYKLMVQMYTSPNDDGDYKQMPWGVPPTPVCEGFNKFYKEFVQPSFKYGENANIPFVGDDGLCPIPAGEYYLKDILFNTESWPNQMPRGTLKVVITFTKDDVIVGGLIATMKIEDDTR